MDQTIEEEKDDTWEDRKALIEKYKDEDEDGISLNLNYGFTSFMLSLMSITIFGAYVVIIYFHFMFDPPGELRISTEKLFYMFLTIQILLAASSFLLGAVGCWQLKKKKEKSVFTIIGVVLGGWVLCISLIFILIL